MCTHLGLLLAAANSQWLRRRRQTPPSTPPCRSFHHFPATQQTEWTYMSFFLFRSVLRAGLQTSATAEPPTIPLKDANVYTILAELHS